LGAVGAGGEFTFVSAVPGWAGSKKVGGLRKKWLKELIKSRGEIW